MCTMSVMVKQCSLAVWCSDTIATALGFINRVDPWTRDLTIICIPFRGHIKGTASAIYAILHCKKCKFKAPGNILLPPSNILLKRVI